MIPPILINCLSSSESVTLFYIQPLHIQLIGEVSGFSVHRYQILSHHLYQDIALVLLQVANDLCVSLDLSLHDLGVSLYSEGSVSRRLQDLLWWTCAAKLCWKRLLKTCAECDCLPDVHHISQRKVGQQGRARITVDLPESVIPDATPQKPLLVPILVACIHWDLSLPIRGTMGRMALSVAHGGVGLWTCDL